MDKETNSENKLIDESRVIVKIENPVFECVLPPNQSINQILKERNFKKAVKIWRDYRHDEGLDYFNIKRNEDGSIISMTYTKAAERKWCEECRRTELTRINKCSRVKENSLVCNTPFKEE